MLSLHQLRCFLATYEHGSLTAAAERARLRAAVGLRADPEPWRSRCGAQLFRRVGRGVVPTTVADTLRPHAERTLAAADEARRAVASVTTLETGTIRFGMFGTARLYAGAGLVADVLRPAPGRAGRADRPELHRGAGRAAARPARGGDDRRTDRVAARA